MPYQTIRLYLQNQAPGVSPAFSPSGVGYTWVHTSQAERKTLGTTRGATAMATKSVSLSDGNTTLGLQFVSDPLGLTAPFLLGSGLVKGIASAYNPTAPGIVQISVHWKFHFVSNDGSTARTQGLTNPADAIGDVGPPPIYYNGRHIRSTTVMEAQSGYTLPTYAVLNSGTPSELAQWNPLDGNVCSYYSYGDVVATDRLVLNVGFVLLKSASTPLPQSADCEYGEANASPLSVALPQATGHPFFDLYVYQPEGGMQEGMSYQRPKHPTHRRERLIYTATPDVPYLGEEAFE